MSTDASTPSAPSAVGREFARVDGPLKVSGTARYSSDRGFPGMLYAVPVCAGIGSGHLGAIDSQAAAAMPGVRKIYTRENIGTFYRVPKTGHGIVDERRPPLEDDVIRYYGQYVALVVADTFEQATAAADKVKVSYRDRRAPKVGTKLSADETPRPDTERGDPAGAFDSAEVKLDRTYSTPVETHNPIELHASIATWDGTRFTLYETTQAVMNFRTVVAQMLGALDHRETAYHPRAFREIYKFIAGREPGRIAILPEPRVRLAGLVTGTPGGVPTNRPVAGATVEVFRIAPDTGERLGEAVHSSKTGSDGRWGPAEVDPTWYLEMVLTSPGATTTHVYRSPFPRSSDIVHLRPARALGPADTGAGAVVMMSRPRGYFGLPRDIVLIDGKEPADIKPGVPTDSATVLRLPATEAGRQVAGLFNEERIVARAWPPSENRIAVIELTS